MKNWWRVVNWGDVVERSLELLRRETGDSLDQCVRDLCLTMEDAVG